MRDRSRRMTTARVALLGAALAPYVVLVSIDAWMHERARQVPRTEQLFHAALAVSFAGFVVAVFAESRAALALLAAFVICAACDEFGYHRHLSRSERRVHFVSYAALGAFVVVWQASG